MAVLRAHPVGQTATGITRGYLFSSKRFRRLPVVFKTIVPVTETFENPRYVRIEEKFSQPTAGREVHDCKVVVGGNIFLITAYWEEDGHKNRAVGSAGKGLIWRGEVAVVQVGRLKPFYKRPKNPSSVNKAVARFVTEFNLSMAVSKPCPTYIDMDD